jgi:two-component system sensor histidine kinase KdpD
VNTRPDPDKLLALVTADEGRLVRGTSVRGNLKIFFGASAGVGKTFAMLSEARRLMADGRNVLIGVIEHHGRAETRALTEGLPVLPLLEIDHRGVKVHEFDLDAALARKPALILMDEFAHTNAPGSRHPKRWQDVEELLDSGIDVYTTLNVQHLESVNDQVARLTGVWVRETVPDSVFDEATDIALIDIPSDELLKRLADGKVYVAEGANTRAAENFFKKTNLGHLRELALRRTAERVDAQNDQLSAALGHNEAALSEKVLVLVGPDSFSARLIRHTRRMAGRAKIPWTALYLQTDRHEQLDQKAQLRVEHNLRLAERMGAQVVRLNGAHAATAIITYATANGFTRVVVGNRKAPFWRRWGKSLSQKLIERGDGLEITTLSADYATSETAESSRPRLTTPLIVPLVNYAYAAMIVAGVTALGYPLRSITDPDNLALFYLTGVVLVAARFGIGPALLASVISIPAFNFFFTVPYYTFNFYDAHYYFTFAFMLVTSLIVGSLTARLSLHARIARKSERETRLLYDLTRGLSSVRGYAAMADVASRHLGPALNARVRLWVIEEKTLAAFPDAPIDIKESGALQWVSTNGQIAGRGTDTLPSARGLYLPLIAENRTLGVLGLTPPDDRAFTGADILVFETIASLIASALQRAQRADEAETSRIDTENEKLRNVLLASLSHDLRTPLTVMNNSVSTLLKQRKKLPREAVDELTGLWGQMQRLQKFVTNLLKMAAITSGQLKLNFEPYLIQEIIGAAIARVEPQKENRQVRTQINGRIPLVMIDGALIEQVLLNLLENAFTHTAANGVIMISVENDADRVRVRVSDDGAGLKAGEEDQIFEKFHTHQTEKSDRAPSGTGLGLAICRGIVQAHGGLIYAKNNPAKEGKVAGASFIFTLPVAKDQAREL